MCRPKYLNSPETPLFHKGANLYNGAAARQAAHDGAPIIVVEGYVDVIAMVTAGYEAAVAPLGTALTEDQLALLWKMTDEPVLCFDGDGAGRRAAYRAVDLALPHIKPGKTVKFALLPEGQDPDDLVRSGGREAIDEVHRRGARPLADMLWQRETEAGGFDTPERRAGLDQRVAEVTNQIGDPSVRKYYRQDLDERVRALFAPAPRSATNRRAWEGASGKQVRWKGAAERSQARPRGTAAARKLARSDLSGDRSLQPDARHAQRAPGARGADPARADQSSAGCSTRHRPRIITRGCSSSAMPRTCRARVPRTRCRPAAARHSGASR